MLYKFQKLAEKLTELGYPEGKGSIYRVIKRDLTQEEQAGNIDFKNDGIYLIIDGQEYKGYMYIKQSFIVKYENKFPKFHITNCEVIQQQRTQGKFVNRYFWHNSNLVDLTDTQTGDRFLGVRLELCSRCKSQSNISEYSDKKGFFNLLDKQDQEDINQEVEVDIFGYTLDWQKISREYRKEKEYTCESCGIMIEVAGDKRFIHVHHKRGIKTNNKRTNLECLCVLCHAFKDKAHENNFKRRRMQADLKAFLSRYKDKLEELNNKYLDGQ